jgi:hypothetical protein
MTDPHDLDELASAHLDGTTSPEEGARLAADPDLMARVEARADELRAVRLALAEPPAVDAGRRDAAIAAALDAFDEEVAPAGAAATVTPLAPRRGLSPRTVRALGAAAVLLLVAVLVPLLAHRRDDDDSASFESTGQALETTVAGSDGDSPLNDKSLAPEAQQDAGPGAVAAPTSSYLGSFEDVDALAAAVADDTARATSQRSFDAEDSNSGSLCVPLTSSTSAVWFAAVGRTQVEVHVDTASDGTRTMTVLERGTCDQLDRREL